MGIFYSKRPKNFLDKKKHKNFLDHEKKSINHIFENSIIEHDKYIRVTGKTKNSEELNSFSYDDPNSDILFKDFKWAVNEDSEIFEKYILKDTSLNPLYKKNYSFENLKSSLEKYCNENKEIFHALMANLEFKLPNVKKYFTNLDEDSQKACTLSLIYYTGSYSDEINRRTNVVIRSENSCLKVQNWKDKEEFYPVMYYMNKALYNLPLFWGKVVRCVEINKDTIYQYYKPGNIITWIQYSSSCKDAAPDNKYFQDRNVWFHIYSLTGRDISEFSNFEENEREILFLPLSHFLVFKIEKVNGKSYIYLKQIELCLSEKNILWVDDFIFDRLGENKLIIEKINKQNLKINIIPKISTECAISFIESMMNQIIKSENFKIVSDMNRHNEEEFENAGARLYKKIREISFLKRTPILIFTSDVKIAKQKFEELGLSAESDKNLIITIDSQKVLDYILK